MLAERQDFSAGDGWRVAGQAVKNKKTKRKRGNQKGKKIINKTKSGILVIFFYTISHARDSLRNS